jgi:hypothetical protein
LSFNVKVLPYIGYTYYVYMQTVLYGSLPESVLQSTRVLPRPLGTFPRAGARKGERDDQ